MTDIVERLRKSAKNVRWTTEPLECAPTIEPDDAEEAADEIERLRAALLKKIEETLWYAYNTGIEKPDGQWTHCFMSDGEDLISQIGLDPSLGYYDAAEVKAAIPVAARAALGGRNA